MNTSLLHKLLACVACCMIWMMLPQHLIGQNESINLNRARERFDNGRFTEAIKIIRKDVLGSKIKRSQQASAYRLLTEIYLTINVRDSADKYMLLYLRKARGLELDATNPDLYHQYRSFKTEPILFAYGKLGINSTQVIDYARFGTGNTLQRSCLTKTKYAHVD